MRAAVGFLTVLPVRAGPLGARSIALFPVVGVLIGLAWALAAWAGYQLGGALVAAALVLAVDLLLTGGLHLDGLADTADGLASRRPPGRVREVMKDPRIGAVGATALATVLLLRFALVAAVVAGPAAGEPGTVAGGLGVVAGGLGFVALVAVPVVGRCALACLLPGARTRREPAGQQPSGAAVPERPASLAAGPSAAATWPAVGTAAGLAALLVAIVVGPVALLGAALAVAAALLVVDRWWGRRLGPSGDILGAGGVLAELVMLAALAVLA